MEVFHVSVVFSYKNWLIVGITAFYFGHIQQGKSIV